ncbi:MAG: hypothetical protein ACXVC7_01735 [Bacteroidia bacterium]
MTLDENDFLVFQLYTASKSQRIKNARIRSWIITTLSFLCFAYFFFDKNDDALGYFFLAFSGFSLIFYPFYSAWRYKRHYLKFIRDTHKNRFEEKSEIEFNDDAIVTKAKSGEVKINKKEIEEINEIKDFYFIKTRAGYSLIISKSKTTDLNKINHEIKSLTDTGIKHNIELNWKWS